MRALLLLAVLLLLLITTTTTAAAAAVSAAVAVSAATATTIHFYLLSVPPSLYLSVCLYFRLILVYLSVSICPNICLCLFL